MFIFFCILPVLNWNALLGARSKKRLATPAIGYKYNFLWLWLDYTHTYVVPENSKYTIIVLLNHICNAASYNFNISVAS
jgi:hypothetical protein